ncbi:leucine-rich repeat-containing protein [Sesbania bispinosa]|nr:leucine-rich repeat-containing protein [Sesbania bispinosa]
MESNVKHVTVGERIGSCTCDASLVGSDLHKHHGPSCDLDKARPVEQQPTLGLVQRNEFVTAPLLETSVLSERIDTFGVSQTPNVVGRKSQLQAYVIGGDCQVRQSSANVVENKLMGSNLAGSLVGDSMLCDVPITVMDNLEVLGPNFHSSAGP